ncbi:hypothetical protein NXT08_24665 (plasmid) [Rhodococcus pyridinivorans]|uniref:hypothetical protein n=1 Tax=Rhodococcus pyridinivorans TaxID=103816 RepID=UPI002164DFF5|nr:hypothetical protein [Rhodococcus pyridinivorans]UVT27774.1 hypothetical protein NXT08_24665 [Rhodococcus pyridinivorans]
MSARCSTGPGRDWDEAWPDQVKVSARGKFVFTVKDTDMAMSEEPARIRGRSRVSDLVPVED